MYVVRAGKAFGVNCTLKTLRHIQASGDLGEVKMYLKNLVLDQQCNCP